MLPSWLETHSSDKVRQSLTTGGMQFRYTGSTSTEPLLYHYTTMHHYTSTGLTVLSVLYWYPVYSASGTIRSGFSIVDLHKKARQPYFFAVSASCRSHVAYHTVTAVRASAMSMRPFSSLSA